MAGENDNTNAVDTHVGENPVRSIEMGMEDKPKVRTTPSTGASADFGADGVTTHISNEGATSGEEGTQADKGGQDQDGGGRQEGEGVTAEASLPDYNPDDAAVVSQYEERYITESGEPNIDALSQSWFARAKQDANGNWTGGLTESEYAFLESKGYSKDMVKSVEAGQVALLQQQTTSLYSRAGGQERLKAALEWGAGGGYTQQQRDRFNALLNGRDREAAADAIDLLMTRYSAATGNRVRPRTKVNPSRSVTANAGAGSTTGGGTGAKPYANQAEWRADLRKARESGDQNLLNQTRARLKASPWHNGGGA